MQSSTTCRATKQVSYGHESAVTVISKTCRLLRLATVLGYCQGKVLQLHTFWSSSVPVDQEITGKMKLSKNCLWRDSCGRRASRSAMISGDSLTSPTRQRHLKPAFLVLRHFLIPVPPLRPQICHRICEKRLLGSPWPIIQFAEIMLHKRGFV